MCVRVYACACVWKQTFSHRHSATGTPPQAQGAKVPRFAGWSRRWDTTSFYETLRFSIYVGISVFPPSPFSLILKISKLRKFSRKEKGRRAKKGDSYINLKTQRLGLGLAGSGNAKGRRGASSKGQRRRAAASSGSGGRCLRVGAYSMAAQMSELDAALKGSKRVLVSTRSVTRRPRKLFTPVHPLSHPHDRQMTTNDKQRQLMTNNDKQ